jgi:hypothetical protein
MPLQTKQLLDPAEYATHDLGQQRKRDRGNENFKKQWKLSREVELCSGETAELGVTWLHTAVRTLSSKAVLLLLADDTVLTPSLSTFSANNPKKKRIILR